MKLKIQSTKIIEQSDWNKFVENTYKRHYNFQQQEGCKERGIYTLTIPSKTTNDFSNDTLDDIVNGNKMGVSLKGWLEADPTKPVKYKEYNQTTKEFEIKTTSEQYMIKLWWSRNFYPSIEMIANDLYQKGLIEKGDYTINIDW